MLFSIVVSLYTSRLVLNALGVSDYGIYNVVGGVVGMFEFINSSLSGATSRFLTFELGAQNGQKLKETFSSSLIIHICVAILIFILSETIGLWFLTNKLVIPQERMLAAHIVYQLSILTCMINITQVPYTAAIIAHEKMGIFALIGIVNVILKLIITLMLYLGNSDKLILYSILFFIVSCITVLATRFYCIKKYTECTLRFKINKKIILPILSFSSWDLYGNLSLVARGQGINILQNLFFGPIINAASGIANQVQSVIASFADNFLTAVRPQIVKNYACGNIEGMQKLLYNASKYSFYLLFLLSYPLIIENSFILRIWLNNVPTYAVILCQLSLINNLVSIMFRSVMFSIHATGKIKRISFINGTIYLLTLPLSYIFLKLGYPPQTPFVINIFLLLCGSISNLITLRMYIHSFKIRLFICNVIWPCCYVCTIGAIIPLFIRINMDEGWVRLIIVTLCSITSISLSILYIGINKSTRKQLYSLIISKIRK